MLPCADGSGTLDTTRCKSKYARRVSATLRLNMQYHSVNTMAMKLNLFRIPELRDLPDTVSRKEVVRSFNKKMWWRILLDWSWLALFLLPLPILLAIYDGLTVSFWLWIAMAVILLLVKIPNDRYERRIKIRKILRTEHQVPICLCCGYLGVSMETQICSECGKAV